MRDNQSIIETNSTKHSHMNTSLCKRCKKSNSIIEFDRCFQYRQDRLRSNSSEIISTDQNSDNQKAASQPVPIEKKMNKVKQLLEKNNKTDITGSSQDITKKKFNRSFKHLFRTNRECQSCPDSPRSCSSLSSQTYLSQFVLQPKSSIEENPTETIKYSSPVLASAPVPVPASLPVSKPVSCSLYLSSEQISYYKKRQTELDHTVRELIKHLTCKTNENINQISKHWSYIKNLCVNKIQPKTNLKQIFCYLLKSIYPNKQFEDYLKENDNIKALLEILSRILNIVQHIQSLSTIKNLFDSVEKTMIEYIHSEFEFLLASYTDTLSMINELSCFYQTRLNEINNLHWLEIIKHDYPSLIERISNDLIVKVPQVDQILVTMLRNMKKRLLCNNSEFINKSRI
ncbi:unnamed protein product [Rotaria sordida]|uniref:Uncharacterized protein n=1 Tax=Rotaria sordida TaxID=392033 RepID=A0A819I8U9_9BILA|nr:unnamed protein product [Rotaria sordida]CAF3912571.1 unnamed protein product [Rotaria sordida]